MDFTISADFFVAVAAGPGGDVGVKAFAVAHHGCEEEKIAALFGFPPQAGGQPVASLRFDGELAVGAIGSAEAREEQAKEMMDFRDCGHGAFAAATSGALLDADRGGETGNELDVGPCELLNELAGVSVHRVKEPSLALGEEEVERQGAFAGATHPGDHHEPIPWNIQCKVLEVVFARPVKRDGLGARADVRGLGQTPSSAKTGQPRNRKAAHTRTRLRRQFFRPPVFSRARAENRLQKTSGMTGLAGRDVLGRTLSHELATTLAGLGPEVEDPVRAFDDV